MSSSLPAASSCPLVSTTAAPAPPLLVCKRKGCKNVAMPCAYKACKNSICHSCYNKLIVEKHKLPTEEQLPEELVACTMRCHKRAVAPSTSSGGMPSKKGGRGVGPWDADTPNNTFKGSSEALLIEWLSAHGNYAKWRGNDLGITKTAIQTEIAKMINEYGKKHFQMRRERTEKTVGAKIQHLEKLYRDTSIGWIGATGQGIKDEQKLDDESDQFKAKVQERFIHFYEMDAVMRERSSVRQVCVLAKDQSPIKAIEGRKASSTPEFSFSSLSHWHESLLVVAHSIPRQSK